jgi:3-oxoacyl-[acyl-carrier-protein] synthase II
MTPLSQERQSAIPGEGAAFFLLSKEKNENSRYGAVVDVAMGRIEEKGMNLSGDAIYFLGADGHKSCDRLYTGVIPRGIEAACYSPLYGSLPAGPAFDMAIAALSIREGRLFASPESVKDQEGFRIIRGSNTAAPSLITCLKLEKEDEYGIITLADG